MRLKASKIASLI